MRFTYVDLLPLPQIVPPDIELFQLKFDLDAPWCETDWDVLSGDERARAVRYHKVADQLRFTRTRATLRHLLAERLHIRAKDVCLSVNQYGKPRLLVPYSAHALLDFNVTHAGSYALIALSQHRQVGVDIEKRNSHVDVSDVEDGFLSPLERQMGVADRPDFFDSWSAKEAVLKALGLGIGEHLQKLSVLKRRATMAMAETHYRLDWKGEPLLTLSACPVLAPKGYAAALAWSNAQHQLMDFT